MTMYATYSPEDDKLRLYPGAQRLDANTYARVKAAGFTWAPKQQLFVSYWSPSREDLLEELCGEVGDEDTSLVERAAQRAERFEEYGEKRMDEAVATKDAVDTLANGIPLGQPILVGHHSERRARKDAERIEGGMRKAVRLWETAHYWTQRAAGAVRAAKYKEKPAVRARRIKKLEADLRKTLRALGDLRERQEFWQAGPTREQAIPFCNYKDHASVVLTDGSEFWSAWSALVDEKVTVEALAAQRLDRLPRAIAHHERWLAHYELRLLYERAMLQEAGGTAADQVTPEVGGACRCWASPRGGWSYIRKVNKVSVTVEDNWGNGGRNFTRTIPFDKLAALLSRDQVETARAEGTLVECEDGTGFHLSSDPLPIPRPAPVEAPADAAFAALRENLRGGGGAPVVQVVTSPTLFPTPPALAARMAALLQVAEGDRVLEPSAGTGNLVEAVLNEGVPIADLVLVEMQPGLCAALEQRYPPARVVCSDFLHVTTEGVGTFQRIIMNPPFDRGGADIDHIVHARRLLQPRGTLVALCANGPRQQRALMPLADYWEPLPAGTFKGAGTMVNCALLVMAGEEVK